MDAQAQLSRGDITNYKSVAEDVSNATIELERYKKEGYLVELSKEEVLRNMSHGTISRLGLIYSQGEARGHQASNHHRPEKRSGGNSKATLPEKLVLPRPKDALDSVRDLFDLRHEGRNRGPVGREMVVVDISDAFMSLGVTAQEIPHTLAPHVTEDTYYFIALLCNLVLSMLLTTTAALGFKVSIKKRARSAQLAWVGVSLTLTEDHLMMGLPDAYTRDLVNILKSSEGRGTAPIRELRQVAGKASWLSGILPRARWVVSIFYQVLHTRLADIKSGAEDRRRGECDDTRDKSALFPVKQLEQSRRWLISYLESAMDKPSKKLQVGPKQVPDPSAAIITDASPEGLGAVLLFNNKVIRAYS